MERKCIYERVEANGPFIDIECAQPDISTPTCLGRDSCNYYIPQNTAGERRKGMLKKLSWSDKLCLGISVAALGYFVFRFVMYFV